MVLLYSFAENDQGSLHFVHCGPAVALAFVSVVGSEDDDAVVIDSCFFDPFHDSPDTLVGNGEFVIVLLGSLAECVAPGVEDVDVGEEQDRFLFLDILHAFLYDCVRPFCTLVIVEAEGVGIIEEIPPFADDSGFRFRACFLQDMEESGLGIVLSQEKGLEIRMVGVADDAGRLCRGAVHHGSPVRTAAGRNQSAFFKGPGTFFHHLFDERIFAFLHAPASPAVKTYQNDM